MKHTIRTEQHNETKKVVDVDHYTRSKAIKAFCTECLGFEEHPKNCTAVMCPLYPYRGKTLVAYAKGRSLREDESTGYAFGHRR